MSLSIVTVTASKLNWIDGSAVCLLESANIAKQRDYPLQHIAKLEKF